MWVLIVFCCLSASCNKTNNKIEKNNLLSAPINVIIDTDIDSDVDDVGALAMLYNLHSQNLINLLGVIVTSDDPYAPTCVSVLNKYYGFEDIPIGFLENQSDLKNHSRYTRQLSEEYPRNLHSYKQAETATNTYRKLLADSFDNSVIIITIGHLSSLQKLLESVPDKYSPLSGTELVKLKVLKWYCMGGEFPKGKEANFYRPDPESTVYCLTNWEKEVVFCGWEIGSKIITGGEDIRTILPKSHPVYRAYQLYNNFSGRASWDQVAVCLLLDNSLDFFEVESNGKCVIEQDGSNQWVLGKKENQGFIKFKEDKDPNEIAVFISKLIVGNIINNK